MNIGLTTVVAGALDKPTQDAFETLTSAVSKGWLTEHELDGQHKATTDLTIDPALFFTETGADLVVGTAQPGVVWWYRILGGVMEMQGLFRGCTVTNTPSEFRVSLPGQWKTRDAAIVGAGWASNNGTTHGDLVVSTVQGVGYLTLTLPTPPWANATANTSFGFDARLRVTR